VCVCVRARARVAMSVPSIQATYAPNSLCTKPTLVAAGLFRVRRRACGFTQIHGVDRVQHKDGKECPRLFHSARGSRVVRRARARAICACVWRGARGPVCIDTLFVLRACCLDLLGARIPPPKKHNNKRMGRALPPGEQDARAGNTHKAPSLDVAHTDD